MRLQLDMRQVLFAIVRIVYFGIKIIISINSHREKESKKAQRQ